MKVSVFVLILFFSCNGDERGVGVKSRHIPISDTTFATIVLYDNGDVVKYVSQCRKKDLFDYAQIMMHAYELPEGYYRNIVFSRGVYARARREITLYDIKEISRENLKEKQYWEN